MFIKFRAKLVIYSPHSCSLLRHRVELQCHSDCRFEFATKFNSYGRLKIIASLKRQLLEKKVSLLSEHSTDIIDTDTHVHK